jgi:hypothetical protein
MIFWFWKAYNPLKYNTLIKNKKKAVRKIIFRQPFWIVCV